MHNLIRSIGVGHVAEEVSEDSHVDSTVVTCQNMLASLFRKGGRRAIHQDPACLRRGQHLATDLFS